MDLTIPTSRKRHVRYSPCLYLNHPRWRCVSKFPVKRQGTLWVPRLFESSCQFVVFVARGFVRERDLLVVVFGEQTYLFARPVSKRLLEPTSRNDWLSSPYAAFLQACELCTPHGRS